MSSTVTKTAAVMVAEAKAQIENMPPERVAEELRSGDVVLVDLREADERAANGVIKGAVHAPRGMLEFYADPTSTYHRPEFDPTRRIILHCASGGRSALGVVTLATLGYTKVGHLDGGLKAWKEQELPVERA
jgi:rhodanese-related sulfurtransferase